MNGRDISALRGDLEQALYVDRYVHTGGKKFFQFAA